MNGLFALGFVVVGVLLIWNSVTESKQGSDLPTICTCGGLLFVLPGIVLLIAEIALQTGRQQAGLYTTGWMQFLIGVFGSIAMLLAIMINVGQRNVTAFTMAALLGVLLSFAYLATCGWAHGALLTRMNEGDHAPEVGRGFEVVEVARPSEHDARR